MKELTKEKLVESLYLRVNFLLEQIPYIEGNIVKIQEGLKNAEFGSLPLNEVMPFYRQVFTFYNTFIDNIRKILIYFPPASEKEKEFLVMYRNLDQESRERVLSFLKELGNDS